jgi:hypothetical protein
LASHAFFIRSVRNGRYTNEAWAKRMLLRGGGLSEAEMERFREGINAIIRKRLNRERTQVDEFRELLEARYQREQS